MNNHYKCKKCLQRFGVNWHCIYIVFDLSSLGSIWSRVIQPNIKTTVLSKNHNKSKVYMRKWHCFKNHQLDSNFINMKFDYNNLTRRGEKFFFGWHSLLLQCIYKIFLILNGSYGKIFLHYMYLHKQTFSCHLQVQVVRTVVY